VAGDHVSHEEHGAAPPIEHGLADVAKVGNEGWSLYEAAWLQPVAINSKAPEARRRKNKPKPLP
jgi:hypothetical protein